MFRDGPCPTGPTVLGVSWGKTTAAFDAVVEAIDAEGQEFFHGQTDTTFDVFAGFCELDLDRQVIDWAAPENQRHVGVLTEKGLLRLEMVS